MLWTLISSLFCQMTKLCWVFHTLPPYTYKKIQHVYCVLCVYIQKYKHTFNKYIQAAQLFQQALCSSFLSPFPSIQVYFELSISVWGGVEYHICIWPGWGTPSITVSLLARRSSDWIWHIIASGQSSKKECEGFLFFFPTWHLIDSFEEKRIGLLKYLK